MDRPYHVSRSTAQFVRRQLPNCENVAYSIPSCTRTQKDEKTKDQASHSRKTSIDDRFCKDGSMPTYEISSQHVNISGQCPKGFNSLKLAATPKNWNTRHYTHCLRLHGQERLSYPSLRRKLLSRSRYLGRYLPFDQGRHPGSVCSFAPNGWISGRLFGTSAAVRSLSLVKLTLLII